MRDLSDPLMAALHAYDTGELGDDPHVAALAKYASKWRRYRDRQAYLITKRIVLDRDGHKCQRCGETRKLTIDHRVPISRGGSDGESNLWTLCEPCNHDKANQTIVEWLGNAS